ncbi:MAG: zinc-ribbon domain-containing protein [Ruminococcus sp.]|nr:zinc-ribbon domain-containing protein [Ruminococcus sp.]MBQ2443264.1 zinc-ribbon domain-containing protein [Ruminococcus sp.]MBQ4171670.1 zinc-ribbon domain-containing protein [Ruminococcus sp.]MBQ4260830.1 zinc-ribbon domain-containing protein [Ruminococcus sp.]
MFCNHCGRQNPDGARFCNFCGAPVSAQIRTDIQAPPLQQKGSKPWYKRWWIWVLIGLTVQAVLTAGVCFLSQYQNQDAENSRQKWKQSLEKTHYEELDYKVLYENANSYIGENILTSVKISDVSRIRYGSIKVDIKDNHVYDIDFQFDDINEPMTYESGDYVVIVGEVDSKSIIGDIVTIKHCHIIEKGKAAVEKMLELEKK